MKSPEFWDEVTVHALEEVRNELRGIVKFRDFGTGGAIQPRIIDVAEDESQIERKQHKVRLSQLTDLDMAAYRNRVNNALQAIIDESETLKRIRAGEPVTEQDLQDLCSLILTQEPGLNLEDLTEYYPQTQSLDDAIRSVIGMDADVVHSRFEKFVQDHPSLASHQIKFLDLLQNHLAKHGSIDIAQLYEPPFTSLHSEGPNGLFDDNLVSELLDIVETFQQPDE